MNRPKDTWSLIYLANLFGMVFSVASLFNILMDFEMLHQLVRKLLSRLSKLVKTITNDFLRFPGCRYKGIKNALKGYMDTNLPILDFTKSDSKDFRGLLVIPARVMSSSITCQIENNTSFLDSRGHWTPLPNIGDVLLVRAYDGHAAGVQRYLALNVRSIFFSLLA